MKYKIFLDALVCEKFISNFMKKCDVGVEDVGIKVQISFETETQPTQELIDEIIAKHEATKNDKTLCHYFSNVKLNRIELCS